MPSRASTPPRRGATGEARPPDWRPELGLPLVGNSDAHTLDTIGDGRTHFPGSTAEDYRRAILGGATTGSCVDWGFVREARIYSRQVRKQARDVVRWGRRNLLRDDTPRDLGVPTDQLRMQRDREADDDVDGRAHARTMAAAAEQREAEEPPA